MSYEIVEKSNVESTKKVDKNAPSLFKLLTMSGGIFILAVVILNCFAYKGLADWVPTMLVEEFGVSADFGVILSTLLPVCTVVGAYLGRFFYHNIFHSEVRTSAFCMLFAAIIYTVVTVVGFISIGFVMVVIMLITLMVSCASTMCVSLVPLRFARYSRAGSLSGFFNGAAYIGNSASALMTGIITENFGWLNTIIVLTAFMAIGAVIAFASIRKWRRFVHS